MITKRKFIKTLEELDIKITESDDDIVFENEVGNFYIDCRSGDEEFFHLVYPAFYEVSDSNKVLVLNACNEANRSVKAAKFFVHGEYVYASVEAFYSNESDLRLVLERSIDTITSGLSEFGEFLESEVPALEK